MSNDFVVPVTCRLCNKTVDVHCNKDDFDNWQNGEGFIQDILHYISAAERELLISSTCGECFDLLFPPLENEDEADTN